MMSELINSAVFPGVQGGPLEHVIAAKAVAFYEALQPSFKTYQTQVHANAVTIANTFLELGYDVVSGGTDNHLVLLDLRKKFPELTGKEAEDALVKADITANKNMVPFDDRTPAKTSGIRIGSPAATTRGLKEGDFKTVVHWIDEILSNPTSEEVIKKVRSQVNELMEDRPLNVWEDRD